MAIEHIQYECEYDAHTDGAVREAGEVKGRVADNDLKPDFKALGWLVLFGLGGGMLSMYYSNVGYLPLIRWEELAIYLGVLTILGSFLLLVFAMLLYVPGRIWCRFLISDPFLEKILGCTVCEKPCLSSAFSYLAIPFLIYMILMHVLLNSIVLLISWKWSPAKAELGLFLGVLVILLAATGLFHWRIQRRLLRETEKLQQLQPYTVRRLPKDDRMHLFKLSGYFSLSGFSSFVALWMIQSTDISKSASSWRLSIVCTAVVVGINVFVAITHAGEPRAAFGVAVLGALALLICGDLLVDSPAEKLSMRTLSAYGVGYKQPATLIIDSKACLILATQNLMGASNFDCSKNAPFMIANVQILSRLGSEYFLLYKNQKIALPKESVLSWSRSEAGQQ